ncbi:protein of unknown function [Cnuella takakiae]|uniref:DUF4249 domain-containing protein n=1 Tax=Cnuella takakiae TaxID=1302690 RepID=A0A1M4XRU9_9BACT|nr:DUF4249 domain-containing protein [Cnuella takakiae]OLY92923.1 hypothetical protein BUE76_14275 [Cnuella takakiae]SHE96297.1 protein of unknown function [Cnuella takakiae]
MKSSLSILLPLLMLLYGCDKAVSFDLEKSEPRLVVEATIENGQAPMVVLTRSQSYFSQISADLLNESFVKGAAVYVSNGQKEHKLKEYVVSAGGFNLRYYTNDSSQPATAFVGELRKDYSLRIVAEGQEYSAKTTIPDTTRRVDSLWWRPVPNSTDNEVQIYVRATDKKGYGDYIRYFTRRNRQSFYPPFTSVFDDFVIDGTTYEIQVEPGFNRNTDFDDDTYFFRRGDTVGLKLANIDKATYDFWRTMEYNYSSIGNPFSTPVRVLSNISGGALGYFGGYAAQYRTMIIPK